MKLVRKRDYYNPFSELERLHEEMNQLFGRSGWLTERQNGLFETNWRPAIDVYDSKDALIVKADVPGMKKEEINVTIENDTLIIKGEKKQEHEEKDGGCVRSERVCGSFYRALTLPAGVDAAHAKAEYKNGTLELTLPKREEVKPKQIAVEVK